MKTMLCGYSTPFETPVAISNGRRRIGERASISLSMMLSTMLGLAFTMVLVNGIRYVTARHALEQAVERSLRCLTPTDAECVSTQTAPAVTESDWYGVRYGTFESTWADRYRYTASIERETWSIEYPGYWVHKVRAPPVRVTEWSVPVLRFVPEVNRYEYRNWVSRAEIERARPEIRFAPRFARNFPEFDPRYEDELKNQPVSWWTPRALRVSGDARSGSVPNLLPFVVWNSGPRRLVSGADNPAFVTDWYEVSDLGIPDGALVGCDDAENPGGRPCSVDYASGGFLPWQESAYVAVKAFARVSRAPGVGLSRDVEVKWAGSPIHPNGTPNGWGLQVETVSRAAFTSYKQSVSVALARGMPPPPPPDATEVECLGGRDWGNVTGDRDFHLVLRGSIKRRTSDNGLDLAGDAACENGDKRHWDLTVERGGAYRVRGWMIARNGDAIADVTFATYVDALRQTTTAPAGRSLCEKGGRLTSLHPSPPETCPLDGCVYADLGFNASIRSCAVSTVTTPSCEQPDIAAQDSDLLPAPPVSCSEFVDVAQCEMPSVPRSEPACASLDSSRIVCGWRAPSSMFLPGGAAQVESVPLDGQPVGCAGAVSVARELACGDGRGEVTLRDANEYGDPALCPTYQRWLSERQLLATALSKIEGFEKTTTVPASPVWGTVAEFDPPRWVDAVFAPTELVGATSGQDAIREGIVGRESVAPIYRHVDRNWKPSLDVFGFGNVEVDELSRRNGVSLRAVRSSKEAITNGYPFARLPEFEIPVFLRQTGATNEGDEVAVDATRSDGMCVGESAPLELRLRSYAAELHAAARDPNIELRTAAEYVDSVPVGYRNSCDSRADFQRMLPRCTPERNRISGRTECGAREYLGRFSDASSPEGPPSCAASEIEASSYLRCERRVVPSSKAESAPTVKLDESRAVERGMEEVARHLPGAMNGCMHDGCANIAVSLSADQRRISVRAQYALAVTFPLNLVGIGPTVMLAEERTAASEAASAGRFDTSQEEADLE